MRAWSKGERGEVFDSLAAWVITVALNLSRSGVRRAIAERRARQRMRIPDAGVVPEQAAGSADVDRAVEALPRRQREVVVLRYLLDLNTKEAAEVLGVSEGTVKSSLAAARSTLADSLDTTGPEEANDRADLR
jgi:RNA polymerase sigma factor (sigma-70 family)